MIAYDPLSPEVRADAYPHYAALRAEPGLVYVKSLDAWAVSRHADVKEVLRNHGAYSSDILIDIAFGPFNPAPEARYMIARTPPTTRGSGTWSRRPSPRRSSTRSSRGSGSSRTSSSTRSSPATTSIWSRRSPGRCR